MRDFSRVLGRQRRVEAVRKLEDERGGEVGHTCSPCVSLHADLQ